MELACAGPEVMRGGGTPSLENTDINPHTATACAMRTQRM